MAGQHCVSAMAFAAIAITIAKTNANANVQIERRKKKYFASSTNPFLSLLLKILITKILSLSADTKGLLCANEAFPEQLRTQTMDYH